MAETLRALPGDSLSRARRLASSARRRSPTLTHKYAMSTVKTINQNVKEWSMSPHRVSVLSFGRARQGVGGYCGVAQRRTHDDARGSVHRIDALRLGFVFDPDRGREPANAKQDQNSGYNQNAPQSWFSVHTRQTPMAPYLCNPARRLRTRMSLAGKSS
jgi:hypothetical protein